jgi:hypothetical protein
VQESRTVVVGCSAWRLLFRGCRHDANSVVRKSTHRKAMRSRPIADQRITRRATDSGDDSCTGGCARLACVAACQQELGDAQTKLILHLARGDVGQ